MLPVLVLSLWLPVTLYGCYSMMSWMLDEWDSPRQRTPRARRVSHLPGEPAVRRVPAALVHSARQIVSRGRGIQ